MRPYGKREWGEEILDDSHKELTLPLTDFICNHSTTLAPCILNIKQQMNSGVPRIFSGGGGGVQQIQLRTEGRENGDLGAVAP
jgi:hypothetical protein